MPEPVLPTGSGPIDPPILTQGGNYPSPSPTPFTMNPSGAGMFSSTLFPYGNAPSPGQYSGNNVQWDNPNPFDVSHSGGNGYAPSNIMQAYMDFYTNNPNASGETAPGDPNYPAPGAGATSPSGSSFMSRLLGSTPAGAVINLLRGRPGDIPAVRIARSIGHLFNPPQSVHDNASSNSTLTPAAGGIGGGAGVTPSDQAWRFSNNGVTGNFQADQTTKGWELAGGNSGNPNNTRGTSDEGATLFYRQLAPGAAGRMGYVPGAPPVTTNPASVEAYNNYIMANSPANAGNDPFAWLNPPSGNTISGPPRFPGP